MLQVRGWRVPFFVSVLLLTVFILPAHAQETVWSQRLNHRFRVVFELPDDVPMTRQTNLYENDDISLAFDVVDLTDERDTLEETCDVIASDRRGQAQIIQGTNQNYCLIASNRGRFQAAIIPYPQPVSLFTNDGDLREYHYLELFTGRDVIQRIADSVSFPEVPSPRLFVKSALELLKNLWYFREDIDWDAIEAQTLKRLTDIPNLDKTYQALDGAIEMLSDLTGDQHFAAIDGDRARAQAEGESFGTGIMANRDGEIFMVVPDSPADRAGLQALDQIEFVDGVPAARFNGYAPGTTQATFVIHRPGVSESFEVLVKRETYSTYIPARAQRLGDVGYVETFGFIGGLEENQRYAVETQEQIAAVDRNGTCGWILDTRRNTGGAGAPIFTAVGPLLGDSDVLKLVDLDGNITTMRYEEGDLLENAFSIQHMVDDPYLVKHPNPPVALLVSRDSASAGEVTPMMFLNREGSITRIFGEQTVGLTSVLRPYSLYDGGQFLITSQVVADRTGQTYPAGIIPDVSIPVDFDPAVYGTSDDPVLQAALDWLHTQPECAA